MNYLFALIVWTIYFPCYLGCIIGLLYPYIIYCMGRGEFYVRHTQGSLEHICSCMRAIRTFLMGLLLACAFACAQLFFRISSSSIFRTLLFLAYALASLQSSLSPFHLCPALLSLPCLQSFPSPFRSRPSINLSLACLPRAYALLFNLPHLHNTCVRLFYRVLVFNLSPILLARALFHAHAHTHISMIDAVRAIILFNAHIS